MPQTKETIVLPLTFTDAIKALREVLGLTDDVIGKVKEVSEAIQRSKGRKTARSLDVLTFKSDGSRKHLERIASGRGGQEDFDALAIKMDSTGANVEKAIDRLQSYRDFLRERYGLPVANKVAELIYAGGGKASIRIDLMSLAVQGEFYNSSKEISEEAERIIANISQLNTRIEELHDLVLRLEKQP